ncbi:MAG: class I SAM-dependent methyltransferase [Phycisphaerae bacterium]|nr:class I SAM-dependent methyltransferase [Phycisphaerae bacterium]
MKSRSQARALVQQYLNRHDPAGWFEQLYSEAEGKPDTIPWADMAPNPNVTVWLDRRLAGGNECAAAVVGCGLGDDAEELSRRGLRVTAFDISQTAIDWCRRRFPNSGVKYVVADLLRTPATWRRTFDFVVESYTLQVLPPDVRPAAIRQLADLVGGRGTLLVVARGREPTDPEGDMPWPLTRRELDGLLESGLRLEEFEDYVDAEDPPVRRFRAVYRRP